MSNKAQFIEITGEIFRLYNLVPTKAKVKALNDRRDRFGEDTNLGWNDPPQDMPLIKGNVLKAIAKRKKKIKSPTNQFAWIERARV